MAQLIGRVKIESNGQRFRTKKGAKLNIGGIKRVPVVASDGSVHYTEDVMEATCEFTMLHTSADDAIAVHALTGQTINFIGDNGVTYVISDAFSTDPPDITDEGEAQFKFAGS